MYIPVPCPANGEAPDVAHAQNTLPAGKSTKAEKTSKAKSAKSTNVQANTMNNLDCNGFDLSKSNVSNHSKLIEFKTFLLQSTYLYLCF